MAPTRTSTKPAKADEPPRRTCNAFFVFRRDKSQEIGHLAGVDGKKISVVAAQIWNSMTEEQQRPYFEAARAESVAFDVKHPNYKYRPLPKGQKRVRSRARKAGPVASTSALATAAPSDYAGPSTNGYATDEIALNLPYPFADDFVDSPGLSTASTPGLSYSPAPSAGTAVGSPFAEAPTLPETPPMFLGDEYRDCEWAYGLCEAALAIPWHQLDADATAEFVAFCEASRAP